MYSPTISILVLYAQLTFWGCYFCPIIVAIMPSNNTIKSAKRRAPAGYSGAKKRAKGTASQPVVIESQQLPSPSPLPITNTLQALASASQAPTFEARVRESRPEDTIVATAEGSEQATAAASEAPDSDKDEEIEYMGQLLRNSTLRNLYNFPD